ncbi:MAG: hypothetical protein CO093_08035 [Alphaproteobacteria bacterium CG_4_9_14_3_um_filter_47_13]|nr:MAG: hypothetical protein CO093_08035 [Alphaproteobacteria bacterium CG_4_9_14_3_um_filter_47_13]
MGIFQDAQIWATLSFLFFLFFMWKFGKDKLLAALDSRIENIRKEIETAESLRIEAQELLAQYQRKQRDAAKEATEIVERAKVHAAEIQKQAEQNIADIAIRREQQLQERLKRMEQNAIQEIRTYAAALAVKATTEIIARQMDRKTNENLIEQSIKHLPKQLG